MHWSPVSRASRSLPAAVTLAALTVPPSAEALEFAFSSFEGSLDTTVAVGMQGRTQSVDHDLVGTRARFPLGDAQKGSAYSVNNDDGTLNYERGIFRTIARFTSELDVSSTNGVFGAFVRAEGYYDPTNVSGSKTDHRELSRPARDQVAKNLRLLDAYGELNVAPGEVDTSLRFGRQVLSWGESTFIPGGINVINPVDVSQLRTPGAELRNALLPQGMISVNMATSDNTSLEGFYQYDWKEVRIDRPGTFFATNDAVGKGGDRLMNGFGDFSEFGTSMTGLFGAGALSLINPALLGAGLAPIPASDPDWFAIPKGDAKKPRDNGQFGVAFRLFAPRLNDTEFGLFFINYHSRLPILSAQTANAQQTADAALAATTAAAALPGGLLANIGSTAGIAVDRFGKDSRYVIEYPENIRLFGLSFNTQLGTSGWALQGEYSFRQNVPLQIDFQEVFFAAGTALDSNLLGGAVLPFNVNQVGSFSPGDFVSGYIRRNVSQVQATGTKALGPILGADTGIVLAEAALHAVHDLPSKSTQRMEAPGTHTSGDPFHASPVGAHRIKDAESSDHFPDTFSWGYRLAARLDFNNAIGAVNLSPRIQWQHDVNGISPGPGGPFLAGRKALSMGLSATYLESWVADFAWTGFFGAGRHNLINDRDYWAASLKYSF